MLLTKMDFGSSRSVSDGKVISGDRAGWPAGCGGSDGSAGSSGSGGSDGSDGFYSIILF